MSDMGTYWKGRHDALVNELGALADRADSAFKNAEIDSECWSASEVFFISNHMEVSDNEEFALKHWGRGKYFKVIKVSDGEERKG